MLLKILVVVFLVGIVTGMIQASLTEKGKAFWQKVKNWFKR